MKFADSIKNGFTVIKWGDWCLISLYISLVSGVVVGLHYEPTTPFYSTTALDILAPYGSYFRSLHFYSSQLFFLLAILHFVVIFDKSQTYRFRCWTYLILTLPVGLMLLFTGYVLRADSTGHSAGIIAENILLSIPLFGATLNNLLFSITEHGLQRVYMHHVISFDLLFLFFAWDHLRRYNHINFRRHLWFIIVVLLFSVFVSAPIDPEELGMFFITGPWFFLGLQELLRYLPTFLAGFLIPVSLIIGLIYLRKENRWFSWVLVFVGVWLVGYGVLTLITLYAHS